MKMLNAMDDATLADRRPADAAVLREGLSSCCARCTRPRRTSPSALWAELGFAAAPAS
jgi:hypothetical protein